MLLGEGEGRTEALVVPLCLPIRFQSARDDVTHRKENPCLLCYFFPRVFVEPTTRRMEDKPRHPPSAFVSCLIVSFVGRQRRTSIIRRHVTRQGSWKRDIFLSTQKDCDLGEFVKLNLFSDHSISCLM